MRADTERFSRKLPLDFLSLERAVVRNAGTVIKDPFAILVLRFIADRTFGWSKDAEYISPGQFLNGIVTKAGDLVCAGLPMAKSKLYACLTLLKEAGAVVAKTVKGRTLYSIPREFVSTMKTAKRLQVAGAATPEVYERGEDHEVIRVREPVRITENSPLRPVRNAEPKESHSPYRTIEEENTCEAGASQSAEPDFLIVREQNEVEAGLAAVEDRAAAIVSKRAARAAAHNPKALVEGLAVATRETWPDAAPVVFRTWNQLGRLKAHSKAWDHPGISFLGFLEWTAVNWRGVWASRMAHVQYDPKSTSVFSEYPTLDSFLIFHQMFRDSYDRRGTQKIRAGLTRRDNLIRERMFKGFSQTDAEADADELLAKEKVREDLNADRIAHNEAARRLQSREQSLETRLALAQARRVQPVSLAKRPVRVVVTHDIDQLPPIPDLPEWKDPEERSATA